MSDNKHGGKREGAGRKPKAEEQKLIENLSPFHDEAIKALEEAIKDRDAWAVKMYFEYFYGKPKEKKDLTITQVPVIDMNEWK